MSDAPLFALGLALACLAGVRAYLTVFGLGLAALFGWLPTPPGLEVLTSPWVLGTAGALAVVEFSADKIPGVDSAWDLLNTLVRIPVGAFLAQAALAPDSEWGGIAAAAGGLVALASHGLKSGTRLAINASPEPFSNALVSLTEDLAVLAGLGLALLAPLLAATLLFALLILGILLLRRLWRWFRHGEEKPLSASRL